VCPAGAAACPAKEGQGRTGDIRTEVNIAFVNLPHRQPIVRRFMCSYRSPVFRLPPYDLLQLATCAREWNGADVCVVDAIAENFNETKLHAFLERHRPEIVVTITGMESVSDDLACMARIKTTFPGLTTVVFGYCPTVLPEVVLKETNVDLILLNEPEESFSAYLTARALGADITTVPGIAGRDAADRVFVNPGHRISDIDRLPFPDYSLVDVRRYEEAFLGGPCGVVLTARGCPFSCTYCTRTYGQRLVAKKPETVVAEIKSMLNAGIRLVRFADDTFTVNKSRVIEICRGILREGLSVPWACLSRADTLDREMLYWMKTAGCVRILVGIESYSPNVLGYLGKNTNPAKTNTALEWVHEAGIETVGMLLVGAPEETDADFQETIEGVLKAPLDFMFASIITPYPATPFFEGARDQIVFSLIPYECRFRDESIGRIALDRSRLLYRRFYLRPSELMRQTRRFLRFPGRSFRLFLMMFWFSLIRRRSGKDGGLF